MALGTRNGRGFVIVIVVVLVVIVFPVFIVIALEPNRRHIDLLGPTAKFNSSAIDQLASTYAALRGMVRVGTTVGGGEVSTSSSSSSSDCDVRRRLYI